MLEKLLRIIATGGVHSHKELTKRLEISEALLNGMLDDLVRMDYLRTVGANCCGACEHCSMGDACAVGEGGRIWVLTEAGQRLARRP